MMKNKVTALLVLISLILSSCNFGFNPDYSPNKKQSVTESEFEDLASRMTELQGYGYFPSSLVQNRSVANDEQGKVDFSSLTSEEQEIMNQIATAPHLALQEISKEANGEAQLVLIDTLLTEEASVQDVYDAMYNIDTDMAYEYLGVLEEQLGQIDGNRSIKGNDILNMKLRQVPQEDYSRGILANDLNWDTIGWYAGYCVTATAGMVIYRSSTWFTPWLKGIGLGVAAGSYALMATQLAKWYSSNGEIQEFVNAIKVASDCFKIIKTLHDKEAVKDKIFAYLDGKTDVSHSAKEVLKGLALEFYGPFADSYKYFSKFFGTGDFKYKIITIAGASLIPCVLAVCSFQVPVVATWNKIVDAITGVLPGINLTVIVPIKRI